MAPPVYKNQQQQSDKKTENKPETTAIPFTHSQNTIESSAVFNALIDKMGKEGYKYYDHIDISINCKILIFKNYI